MEKISRRKKMFSVQQRRKRKETKCLTVDKGHKKVGNGVTHACQAATSRGTQLPSGCAALCKHGQAICADQGQHLKLASCRQHTCPYQSIIEIKSITSMCSIKNITN